MSTLPSIEDKKGNFGGLDLKAVELLLVDDEANVERTQRALAQSKVRVRLVVAADGAAALACLRQPEDQTEAGRPDVVLLGAGQDRASSERLLSECRSLRIPVAAVVDSVAAESEQFGGSIPAVCSLTEPVDFLQIVHLVQSVRELGIAIVRADQVDD